jgi:hypothetical protein
MWIHLHTILIVILTVLILPCYKTEALDLIDACYLSDYTINVRYDQELNSFVKVEEDNSPTRNLRGVTSRSLLDTTTSTDIKLYKAKWCECAVHSRGEQVKNYCIVSNKENVCQVPLDETEPVLCSRLSSVEVFAKNAWPISLLWFVAMAIYVVFTDGGRHVGRYFWTKLCWCCCDYRSINENVVEEALRHEAEDRMQRRDAVNRSPMRNQPVVYILKTQEFSPSKTKSPRKMDSSVSEVTVPMTPDSSHDSHHEGCCISLEEDEVVCTICIGEIVEGDKIGALPCEHQFHVGCLKEWLRRKNVCPLCQGPIANVKEDPSDNTDTNATDSETSNSRQSGLARLVRIRRARRSINRQRALSALQGNSDRRILVGDPGRSATTRIHVNIPPDAQQQTTDWHRSRNRDLLERRRQYLSDIQRQLNH